MLRNLILFSGISIFLTACSTKVELNTEWKDTTIVFGLLDQKDEYHYIKINKAFLGDGDYYDYAMIRDSSEYKNVNARVEELLNGTVVNTYILRDTVLSNKPTTGAFYGPDQTVYYFKKSGLDNLNTYRLVANINEGTASAKEVTAETKLIEDFSIVNPASISLGSYDGSDFNYNTPEVKFTPPASSDAYEVIWRAKWDEYNTTDTVRKYYDWLIGKKTKSDAISNMITCDVSAEAFLINLGNAIPYDPLVTKRVFKAIDVIIYAASDDLETYINVNSPQSGLVQERPEFTNVSNGLGLFSSRLHVTNPNKHVTLGGMRLIVHSPYTVDLMFCSDSTAFEAALPPLVKCTP